ncbi:hypothetical protein M9Y10_043609 [Tritrichomonas musculus]|uniref:sn-1-specific diacylglycerol lipase n=1 Tax=Tritrichomonas musculus TaxID=1915356 RepID=A0ABR2K073_9EUKA
MLKFLTFATIVRLFTRILFFRKLRVESIDMTEPTKFSTIASLTMNLSKDIYTDSLEMASYDNNFSIFINNPQYFDHGKIILNVSANADEYMPKILIWDWHGNETVNLTGARIIVIRGTQSFEEWMGNFDCAEKTSLELGIDVDGWFHKNFGLVGQKIWNDYNKYIVDSHLPVIITGHSRGGGIAEVLHVIAKKKLQNILLSPPLYCMAHAPPPSMFLTDKDSFELTKDIYGFVNGADMIPRFFVTTVVKLYNKIKGLKDAAYSCCTTFYSKSRCTLVSTQQISVFAKIISSLFPVIQKSNIIKALFERKNSLFQIMENFQFNPNNVNIKKHVGNLYHLNWQFISKNSSQINGCIMKPLMDTLLDTPENLTEMNIGIKFWKVRNLVNDHDPQLYHHAFVDPLCKV